MISVLLSLFSSATVDLSDMRGFVRNLTDHKSSNASDFLNERETFVLVQVESKLFAELQLSSALIFPAGLENRRKHSGRYIVTNVNQSACGHTVVKPISFWKTK